MEIQPITINTILYCRQWDDMVRFYKDCLGLPVVLANEWFMEFRLTPTARLSIADERRSTVKSAAGKGITLTVEVNDVNRVHQRMQDLGLNPTRIRRHPWDAWVFNLFDPEGNRLEIWQADETGPTMVTGEV